MTQPSGVPAWRRVAANAAINGPRSDQRIDLRHPDSPAAVPQPGHRRPAAALGDRAGRAGRARRHLAQPAARRAAGRREGRMSRPPVRLRRPTIVRPPALPLLIIAFAIVGFQLPLRELAADASRIGPAVAIAGGAALMMLLIPRTVVSLACGALFGTAIGAGCAVLAAFAGA